MEASCHLRDAGPLIRAPLVKQEFTQADAPHAAAPLSFEAVYEQYFDYVWSLVRRFGVPPEAVADIVQDVFLVVHRKLDTVRVAIALPSWLHSVARRCASGHHRRSRLLRHSTGDVDEVSDIPNGESPADLAERSDKARQLWLLLESLDGQKREVFIMAELGELSCPEIAEALGIPLNTAYSRLRHAREAFEAVLARYRARTKEPL